MKVSEIIYKKITRKLLHILSGFIDFFYYRFFYSKPVLNKNTIYRNSFLIGGGNTPKEIASLFCELFPDKVEEKIKEADLIYSHVFDLLGSGPIKLRNHHSLCTGQIKTTIHYQEELLDRRSYEPIDWHCDFKSGYRWNPGAFHRHISYGHIKGVDIKVPWELSRFQHLSTLGQAYVLTKNRKYADEFQNQILDWIEHNKTGFGVNWECTMDVALRAANWLVAQEYFLDHKVFFNGFWREFYTSIYEHGNFIFKHLENHGGFTDNHYISDLVGLFFIAVYCPFFKESKRWREFAVKELSKEIKKQVYSDGCNFEASTSYHRLVLELLFYAELLGNRAGIEFPEDYQKLVRKMFEFSLYGIKPNGRLPQVGDNDNGRFLIFNKKSILNHQYLLSLGAVYYKDPLLKVFDFDEEALWIFGEAGKEIYNKLSFRKKPIGSKGFQNVGWYIMRHNNNYCFISCGPNGQNGRGGHAHNDKLSFELMLNGEEIIIDPGTYVYTPSFDWRNKFRSTSFHNTVQIDDIEQNDISKDLFLMKQGVECRTDRFEETEGMIVFEGKVKYIKDDIKHRRKIILHKHENTLEIIDEVMAPLPRKIIMNLCLGCCALKYDLSLEKGLLEETEGFYSRGYGEKTKTVFYRHITEKCSYFKNRLTVTKSVRNSNETNINQKRFDPC